MFGPFGLDFFTDDKLLLTETDLTEQKEQTEIGQLNDKDIDNFITENWNKNTTKKTESDLNVFYRWAKTFSKTRTLENISEQELDKHLPHFVLNARKQNKDKYEPDTLTSLLRSFDHLLGEKEKTLQYSHWQTVCEGQRSSVLQTKAASPCLQRAKAEQSAWIKWNLVSEPMGWETTRMPHTTLQSLFLRTVWFNNTVLFTALFDPAFVWDQVLTFLPCLGKLQCQNLFIRTKNMIVFAFVNFQYEMLTGALPFQGKDRKDTMNMILKWVKYMLCIGGGKKEVKSNWWVVT